MFRRLVAATAACVLAATVSAADYVAGTHYKELSQPVRTANPDKIEVVEVFWYGCIHCFNFEPKLKEWEKTLPEDVDFHQSPAMWNELMALHARAFYAAEALGKLEVMNGPLFEELNVKRKRLSSEDELAELFVANGVDEAEFRKAFNSFGVKSKVKQADARARGYQITGTPAVIVDGKYLVTAKGGYDEVLNVAEFLIEKERQARSN